MGAKFRADVKYGLKMDLPLEFYHEMHRPLHFSNFANVESEFGIDREDEFS
jgi:pre-mRNA-processing factor 8